ncbi:MAG: hypothetical protein ACRDSR_07980 [Pseudonocardiaceae bacterium]
MSTGETFTSPPPLVERCEVADVPFAALPDIPPPNALISLERVRGAGSLLLSYRYGDQLRFFDAVDAARTLLDTDRLCLDGTGDQALLNRLYCWPELEYRVSATTRRSLVAKVFGIPSPDVGESERDTAIQPMLMRLLDAINAVCDPGPFRSAPTAADEQRVEFAAFAVQARLSLTMTGLTTMLVRDLQRQFTASTDILTDLAARLQLPCRPGVTEPDLWGSLDVLVGDQLRADGVDLFEAADIADAWRAVFAFLATFTGGADVSDVCQAAAVLRPPAADCVPDSESRRHRLR